VRNAETVRLFSEGGTDWTQALPVDCRDRAEDKGTALGNPLSRLFEQQHRQSAVDRIFIPGNSET
jgi:hypothetical protein